MTKPETPRTDEEADHVLNWHNDFVMDTHFKRTPTEHLVSADFARTLERELSAAKEEAQRLREDIEARILFEVNAHNWTTRVPWDELHEDTRQFWRDHAAARRIARKD